MSNCRLFFPLFVFFFCGCTISGNPSKPLFKDCEIQETIESYITTVGVIDNPQNRPTIVQACFLSSFPDHESDTLILLRSGLFSFVPEDSDATRIGINGSLFGAVRLGDFVIELIYDGFEHQLDIVNENLFSLPKEEYEYESESEIMKIQQSMIHWFSHEFPKKRYIKLYRYRKGHKLELISEVTPSIFVEM